jgi:Coenzyme PQQ synthesis protein D (PqqD)
MSAGGESRERLRHSEAAIWARVLDQTVILNLSADHYTRLNGTAGELWEQLTEPRTESELAQALVRAHGIDARRARADVQAFLAPLFERGLIESAERTPG